MQYKKLTEVNKTAQKSPAVMDRKHGMRTCELIKPFHALSCCCKTCCEWWVSSFEAHEIPQEIKDKFRVEKGEVFKQLLALNFLVAYMPSGEFSQEKYYFSYLRRLAMSIVSGNKEEIESNIKKHFKDLPGEFRELFEAVFTRMQLYIDN